MQFPHFHSPEKTLKKALQQLISQIDEDPTSNATVKVDLAAPTLEILNEAPYYSLVFPEKSYIHLECFWRAISDSRVVFGINDDSKILPFFSGGKSESIKSEARNQSFDATRPFSVQEAYDRYYSSKRVTQIIIRNPIQDLQITFDDGSCLEACIDSGTHESWTALSGETMLAADGGGRL
jgi:hypothetical protein